MLKQKKITLSFYKTYIKIIHSDILNFQENAMKKIVALAIQTNELLKYSHSHFHHSHFIFDSQTNHQKQTFNFNSFTTTLIKTTLNQKNPKIFSFNTVSKPRDIRIPIPLN